MKKHFKRAILFSFDLELILHNLNANRTEK